VDNSIQGNKEIKALEADVSSAFFHAMQLVTPSAVAMADRILIAV